MKNPGKIKCRSCKEEIYYNLIVEIGVGGCICNKCYVPNHKIIPKENILKIMRD